MPSPASTVKDGAAAAVATTNGVDVTPGNTITIALASTADVDTWSIQCITTDDSSDKDTVSAALVIDSVLRTATFTAPAPGKAYRFQSKVNSGVDRNGVARTSYVTTFAIYTRINGRRVIAFDETTEGDANFGWTKWQNDIVRSLPSGVPSGTWDSAFASGGGGGGGAVQFFAANNHFLSYQGGSAVGATGLNHIPTTGVVEINRGLRVVGTAVASLANAMILNGTLVSPRINSALINGATIASVIINGATIASPMLVRATLAGGHLVSGIAKDLMTGGTVVHTGTSIRSTGNAYHRSFSDVANVQTSNATVTNLYTWTVTDESVGPVFVEVTAVPSGSGGGGSYGRRAMIMANGGVATCSSVEATWDTEMTKAGFTGISVGTGVSIGVSGLSAFVKVKGTATGSISWGCIVNRSETAWV